MSREAPRQWQSAMEQRRVQLFIAVGAAMAAMLVAFAVQRFAPAQRDIGILLQVTRAYLHGQNPYEVMGPGRSIAFPESMAYPFTEVLLLVPFAVLPQGVGSVVVVGVTCGLWAWALLQAKRFWPALAGGLSLAALFVAGEGQWAPLLIAAALMPALGWVLAIKPTIGLALFAAFPSRRTATGVVLFCVVSLAFDPRWPFEWYASTRSVQHLVAIVTRPGGVLVLLAALRWREPAARLLVALACVPHTTLPYETLYLFLVPQTWSRAWLLAALTFVAPAIAGASDRMTTEYVQHYADAILWTSYVPCLLMILFPPGVLPVTLRVAAPARMSDS